MVSTFKISRVPDRLIFNNRLFYKTLEGSGIFWIFPENVTITEMLTEHDSEFRNLPNLESGAQMNQSDSRILFNEPIRCRVLVVFLESSRMFHRLAIKTDAYTRVSTHIFCKSRCGLKFRQSSLRKNL